MSLEDSSSSLLPGAHETRNAANVCPARRRRVYATSPNTGNHSGQPVWGIFRLMQWPLPPSELYENSGKCSADSQFALVIE
ncbi:hypothetical protein G5I_06445 [Acromyrmex echinatior]|uniref:Uncharacterized protein n=1 Tax=Acromyrmex echinatior TaxID=103372 RepID=F4WL22_ACREC|nr:hypothetical protein G5I_06445 [Acromyrmex echinatior]